MHKMHVIINVSLVLLVADLEGLVGYISHPPCNLKEYKTFNVVIQKCTKTLQ